VLRNALRATPEERRAYLEDGYFLRHAVFDRDELADLRAAAERAVAVAASAAASPDAEYAIDGNRYVEADGSTIQFEHCVGSQTVRVLEPFHRLDPRFQRLVDDPRFVEPMRDLVGANDLCLFTDKLNLKRPREGSRFRWHQDSPYWVFDCAHVDRLANAMLALDDASRENGCLWLVPGTHRAGLLPGLTGEGTLGPLFTDPRSFDGSRAVPAEMPAGSLLFFSPHLVHGSAPNTSDKPRRALLFTYQPAPHRMFKIPTIRPAGPDRPG
jgi:ectoine hydroxylase-related dioxygenase (phytanoyl-CoA dioxygenase family)